jgi:hypothetical protein
VVRVDWQECTMQGLAVSGRQEIRTRPPKFEFNSFFPSLVEEEHGQSSMDGVAKQTEVFESVVIS